ncbi:MAG: M1 family aminopeptidase [Pacificimonas sp.]
MFGKIAAFELRYQLTSPVFWSVVILFFLLTFGAVTIDQISIGSGGNVNINSPQAITQIQLILSLFFMFVTTAFVANVIVRDDESGFGPMVRSTRVRKFDYLLARFTGAFLIAALAFLVVPVAIWLGSLMPWLDQETVGPNRLVDYASSYLGYALPNIFLTSAIFFAIATLTRSMMYSYLGVVIFLVAYIVFTTIIGDKPEYRDIAAIAEPFGFAAFSEETRYWTAAQANTLVPPLTDTLFVNRLLWIGIGIGALFLAFARFTFATRPASKRATKRAERKTAKLAKASPELVQILPATTPNAAGRAQLVARTKFEMGQVFRSPAFVVLLLIGLFNASGALYGANETFGTPSLPLTFSLLTPLAGSFTIIPLIIAVYYAGELVWRDRERGIHEIIDSTPLPNWAYMVPKTLALLGVLLAVLIISVVAGMLIQLLRGWTDLDLGNWFVWYVLPQTVSMLLLAILAVFVQAVSPNKYVGWGIMVVYLVTTLTLSNIGFEHPLYDYGGSVFPQVSDMNLDRTYGEGMWWLFLYWTGFALVLAVLAHLLWRRGTETRLAPRLARVPARLKGAPGVLIGAGTAIAVATGLFIYQNMNVLNDYRTTDDGEAALAELEKKYLKYADLPQPMLTDIALNVDLYPEETRAVVTGHYDWINDTGAPLEEIHVRIADEYTQLAALDIPGAALTLDDEKLKYRIYRFDEPVAPDATGRLTFRTIRHQRGFAADGNDTRLVENGTFLNNQEIAPTIGMSEDGLLSDRQTRREYGLPAELRLPKLEDESARQKNYVGNAPWVRSDITITTSADQVPVAPGARVSDEIVDGRRTARFVASSPILAFFSIQSANYDVARREHNGIELEVYHHPAHDYNVASMLNAMARSLDYYQVNFGPYQFDHARIIEFPAYASFAQAFAGTMPYSEGIGFIADTSDPEAINYVDYVTAHEVAHQWWAHQLISARQQGGTMLVETLAQYSALMVMKDLYGEDKMRRFLKYELDRYLSARGGEAIEELPLNRVEDQGYIHYRKGSVATYLLQERLGEARVNEMLAGLIEQYRFKGAPFANANDLVNGYRALARNDAERQLVEDLLTRITIWDFKVEEAETQRAENGWETTLTVSAAKAYADGLGTEEAAPLSDMVPIGLFTARPGFGAFDENDVIMIEPRAITDGTATITVRTDEKPLFAGLDPYNLYIDRNSDDNVIAVDEAVGS